MNGALPDPVATPGATNPAVIDATLGATIGSGGWTATVRPSVAYTNALKAQQMLEYGLTGAMNDYEEDRLVPLCCGSSPTSYQNLWPQRRTGDCGAAVKDRAEVLAQHAILSGVLRLHDAQAGFMADWTQLHDTFQHNARLIGFLLAMPPPDPGP